MKKEKEKKKVKSASPKKNKKNDKKNLFIVVVVVVIAIVVGLISFFAMKPSINNIITSTQKETEPVDLFDFDANYKDKKVVVAYFSATGNTKIVAEKIANIFKCDAVAIEPVEPYTETDLTSYHPTTRPMRESAYDPFNPPEEPEEDEEVEVKEGIQPVSKLPEIKKLSLNRYDTIILGYPIWFGDAPRVMYTFVSETNLKNKTIIPFCTSDSNEIEPSDSNLMNFASDDVNFMAGKRFTPDMSEDEIKEFFTQIGVDINIF